MTNSLQYQTVKMNLIWINSNFLINLFLITKLIIIRIIRVVLLIKIILIMKKIIQVKTNINQHPKHPKNLSANPKMKILMFLE